MENAILVGLSRQVALARELDVIANNVANVTTNGFKARNAKFSEFLSPKASADSFPRPDRRVSYVVDSGTPLDPSQGAVERTGNPLDVAIKGDALFVVQTPGGERYTRNGSFEINAQGQLVTSDGFPVLGENGPVVFAPGEFDAAISPDGTVTSDQGERGALRLVRFADPQVLENQGANVFSATIAPQPAGDTSSLETGAVERSNVKPILEMSRMIEVNRAYTSLAGMLQRTDELRRSAIQRLADTNV